MVAYVRLGLRPYVKVVAFFGTHHGTPLTHSASCYACYVSQSRYAKGGQDMYLKKFRQANTGLLYKQTRFNVLNEETEGYAKVPRH